MAQRTIAVIDGNSLMHRAFHAVPPYMNAPDGRPTNACFGFMSMFLKLVEDFKPDAIICAFDKGIPVFRLEAIEAYKAQRPPTDVDLKTQFPMIKEMLRSMNIAVVEREGWEGDDILGSVAALGEAAGSKVLLVTGDKDALQLVSEATQVVNNKTGMSDVVIYDVAAVYEKWGVMPDRVPDFLGLMGDSSDNIPGVPGVGPKTATKLLQEYDSLEDVLAHADEIKGKLGDNIRANREQALASKRVATISRDVELDLDLDALRFPDYQDVEVTKAFKEFAMTSQLKKVLALINKRPQVQGAGAEAAIAEGKGSKAGESGKASIGYDLQDLSFSSVIVGEAALAGLKRDLEGQMEFSAVLDTGSGKNLFDNCKKLYLASLGLSKEPQDLDTTRQSCYVFEGDDIALALQSILDTSKLLIINSKTVLQELILRLVPRDKAMKIGEVNTANIFDISLAAYLLDSGTATKTTEQLSDEYLQGVLPTATTEMPEAAISAVCGLLLCRALKAELKRSAADECFMNIEMPLAPVLLEMTRYGVNIDVEVLKQLSASMQVTIEDLRSRALALAGEPFNLDSPKQLGAIMFEKLKLPAIKKGRTGYSTDASVLQELASMHDLPKVMLEYRELAKLKSTYLDALPQLIGEDGHIHTSFNQTVTTTGRLSSSDPNLQNIPVRSELGRRIREAFIPDPSCFDEGEAVFLSADYSQIELRLLAHLSEDPGLIAAFEEGLDFHSATAARVFGIAASEVDARLRSRAKAVNFGIVYGQQAYGLSQTLSIGFAEAQEMITRYFKAYPRVRSYLDETVQLAKDQGWVATMFGRRRYIKELRSPNPNLRAFGERTAMNHPMQGSAADIIKLAMIEVQRRIVADGFSSQMILQVHDELDFNCVKSECERLGAMVKEVMEGVAQLKVPLVVEVCTGDNWARAH